MLRRNARQPRPTSVPPLCLRSSTLSALVRRAAALQLPAGGSENAARRRKNRNRLGGLFTYIHLNCSIHPIHCLALVKLAITLPAELCKFCYNAIECVLCLKTSFRHKRQLSKTCWSFVSFLHVFFFSALAATRASLKSFW